MVGVLLGNRLPYSPMFHISDVCDHLLPLPAQSDDAHLCAWNDYGVMHFYCNIRTIPLENVQ